MLKFKDVSQYYITFGDVTNILRHEYDKISIKYLIFIFFIFLL